MKMNDVRCTWYMTSALPYHLSSVGSFGGHKDCDGKTKRGERCVLVSFRCLRKRRASQELNNVLDEMGHCTQSKSLVFCLRTEDRTDYIVDTS